jgi:hypothetical protein
MISSNDLMNWFTYHAPDPAQVIQYAKLRDAALVFAEAIRENTPVSADQTAAIRKVREAVMTANAAIACGGK